MKQKTQSSVRVSDLIKRLSDSENMINLETKLSPNTNISFKGQIQGKTAKDLIEKLKLLPDFVMITNILIEVKPDKKKNFSVIENQ